VIRADAGEGIIVRQANVAHFRVGRAVHEASCDNRAAADSGADGQIDGILTIARRTPAGFAERGGVYVCVEACRNTESPLNRTGEIAVAPGGLGRGCDVAPPG